MRKFVRVFNLLLGSFVCTAALAVFSIIFIMFTQGRGRGRRTGLFDSVYFEVTEKDDGALVLSAGVNNFFPLLLIYLLFTLVIFLAYIFVRKSFSAKKICQPGSE